MKKIVVILLASLLLSNCGTGPVANNLVVTYRMSEMQVVGGDYLINVESGTISRVEINTGYWALAESYRGISVVQDGEIIRIIDQGHVLTDSALVRVTYNQ